jgi:hypothetical protein
VFLALRSKSFFGGIDKSKEYFLLVNKVCGILITSKLNPES